MVQCTMRDTSDLVMSFFEEEVIFCFSPRPTFLSDYTGRFKARAILVLMNRYGVSWKTVLVYAPMSNLIAERMAATIKK